LAASIGLVYILILALSRKAMAPVAQSVEKQKQFITDASHELKTPLTVITTSLKVLEMDVGPQKWIDKAQSQVEHLKELVNQLVTLSRLDEEKPPLMLTQFSISEAVQETAESFRDFAAANNRTLELEITQELTYCGDEYAIRQLVSILMDNAVKYSDENGHIRLTLEKTKKGILLRAFNTCPEMDIAQTDKLFDRFYRIDKSRSKQAGGFGIGLSIARGIVQAHGGSIRASCPDPRSIEFTVILKQPARKKAEK
ncbi:MAG: sensor histidine kinase, partial [Oscillospiraceae bacterium]